MAITENTGIDPITAASDRLELNVRAAVDQVTDMTARVNTKFDELDKALRDRRNRQSR